MVETDQSAYSIFRVQDEEIHVLGFLVGNLTDYSNSDNLNYTRRYEEEKPHSISLSSFCPH